MRRWSFGLFLLFFPTIGQAQVVFTSPRPFGILQVRGQHAELWLHLALSNHQGFSYKLSSDVDTTSPEVGWQSMSVWSGVVDTVLTVPRSLRSYTLLWRTGRSPSDTGGSISGLTPGHIIGIAGQSNAVGWVWEHIEFAEGDIRMLANDSAWEPAHEPTAGIAEGPWIVMANKLYAAIGDTLPIGIVNVAVGGTGLFSPGASGLWLRNADNPEDTSIYGKALHRFRRAGGRLECLCWIQGENEGAYFPYLPTVELYRMLFDQLMSGFHNDLLDTFPIFHLQVGGWTGSKGTGFPNVHQAQLSLPHSTLVGTALGLGVQGDGVHYLVDTYKAVGRMFADALLKERYGIMRLMYPPLVPDTLARLDSILDGSIPGRYCVAVQWKRDGRPVHLTEIHSAQYFALYKDGTRIDTGNVWFRISSDSTKVLVGLRADSITRGHDWRVSYDDVSSSDLAPIAAIEQGDTIFAASFDRLGIDTSAGPTENVKLISLQFIEPNPSHNGVIRCRVISLRHQVARIELRDERGGLIYSKEAVLDMGMQVISIPTIDLASGTYWLRLAEEQGSFETRKVVIFR
jgi:hypothetical protein